MVVSHLSVTLNQPINEVVATKKDKQDVYVKR